MSATSQRLTIMKTFSFICILVFAVSSIVQADSGEMIDLKGTGSSGSFNYGEDKRKIQSAIGYGVNHRKSEGSKGKSYIHGSKVYSGHISGSNSQKKQEGSQLKSYSHEKLGHEKSNYDTKDGHGKSYGHKKPEGSQSKSYSHRKPGHGKSSHSYKGGHKKSYGHKKGSHGGHGVSPFKHVMNYKYKLGLTDAQIQIMKELDVDFKKKIVQAKADHEIAHMELDLHVHSGKIDESKIRDAGAKIVASKTNKIIAMIDAKIQLLSLLTAEQRQKMAKMH
jgi:Spy/CpxP family protein refolding chaperone